jgi:hypothetical protein
MADTFTVIAQSYTGSRRISRAIGAASEAEILRLVSAPLDAAGFYPISIEPERK